MSCQSITSAWAFSRRIVSRSSAAAAGQFKAMASMAPPASHFISHSLVSIFPAPQQNPWVKRGLESDPSTGVKRAPVG